MDGVYGALTVKCLCISEKQPRETSPTGLFVTALCSAGIPGNR